MKMSCKRCNVEMKPGMALMNLVGKIDRHGCFVPAEKCEDGDTIYPVNTAVSMIAVDKCPKCGYSVARI